MYSWSSGIAASISAASIGVNKPLKGVQRTLSLHTGLATNCEVYEEEFYSPNPAGFSPSLSRRGSFSSTMSGNIPGMVRTLKIKDVFADMGNIYRRALSWGTNFPEANGSSQSPINLNSRQAIYDSALNEHPMTLSYTLCRELDMLNNGHTVVTHLRYKPGDGGYRTDILPKSTLQGGPLPAGHEYEMSEFRFHWGREDTRGSEHTVNLKAYPMELHLMHWNSTIYKTFEDALGKDNGIATIALFVQIGQEHAGLKVLTDSLEEIQHKGKQKTLYATFNPNCLLPDPMLRDFWTYDGSLTIPPCTEKVTWVLFRYPLIVSHQQVEEFRRLKTFPKGGAPRQGEDGMMTDNFRPTQPINDRVMRASFL